MQNLHAAVGGRDKVELILAVQDQQTLSKRGKFSNVLRASSLFRPLHLASKLDRAVQPFRLACCPSIRAIYSQGQQ
jgi:hypothetical protein